MNLCIVQYRVHGVFNGNGYSDFTGWVVGDHQVDRRNALNASHLINFDFETNSDLISRLQPQIR